MLCSISNQTFANINAMVVLASISYLVCPAPRSAAYIEKPLRSIQRQQRPDSALFMQISTLREVRMFILVDNCTHGPELPDFFRPLLKE